MIPLQQILDGLPAERRAYIEARTRELIAETALKGAVAPVVLLSPGERPTEPGWYVVEARDGERQVVQIDRWRGKLQVWLTACDMPTTVDGCGHSCATFIARIYPDRIEGREG